MSNFYRRTKNPVTGRYEDALWLDDCFGRHRYGVRFESDGALYQESDHQWEFQDAAAPSPSGDRE